MSPPAPWEGSSGNSACGGVAEKSRASSVSEPKKKRLCLANKPTDAGVPVVTSATGGDVLLQLAQTGRRAELLPPLSATFGAPGSLYTSLISFLSFIPLTSVPRSARLVVSVKSGALFPLPKRMKLFKARTHGEAGVGPGKRVRWSKGGRGAGAGGREERRIRLQRSQRLWGGRARRVSGRRGPRASPGSPPLVVTRPHTRANSHLRRRSCSWARSWSGFRGGGERET